MGYTNVHKRRCLFYRFGCSCAGRDCEKIRRSDATIRHECIRSCEYNHWQRRDRPCDSIATPCNVEFTRNSVAVVMLCTMWPCPCIYLARAARYIVGHDLRTPCGLGKLFLIRTGLILPIWRSDPSYYIYPCKRVVNNCYMECFPLCNLKKDKAVSVFMWHGIVPWRVVTCSRGRGKPLPKRKGTVWGVYKHVWYHISVCTCTSPRP